MVSLLNESDRVIYVLLLKRQNSQFQMFRFWLSFVIFNIAYYSIWPPGSSYQPAAWKRIASSEYIRDRSCVQLSHIWNYGAPRGCEVTEHSRRAQGWEYVWVPEAYSIAPTSVLLHDIYITRIIDSWAKVIYLILLLVSGGIITYKYIVPQFKLDR